MRKFVLLQAVCVLLLAGSVRAELWKCGTTFTNSPAGQKNSACTLVRAPKVCGAGRNSFIGPSRAVQSKDTACKAGEVAASPLYNKKALELAKKSAHQKEHQRKPELTPPPKAQAASVPKNNSIADVLKLVSGAAPGARAISLP